MRYKYQIMHDQNACSFTRVVDRKNEKCSESGHGSGTGMQANEVKLYAKNDDESV